MTRLLPPVALLLALGAITGSRPVWATSCIDPCYRSMCYPANGAVVLGRFTPIPDDYRASLEIEAILEEGMEGAVTPEVGDVVTTSAFVNSERALVYLHPQLTDLIEVFELSDSDTVSCSYPPQSLDRGQPGVTYTELLAIRQQAVSGLNGYDYAAQDRCEMELRGQGYAEVKCGGGGGIGCTVVPGSGGRAAGGGFALLAALAALVLLARTHTSAPGGRCDSLSGNRS